MQFSASTIRPGVTLARISLLLAGIFVGSSCSDGGAPVDNSAAVPRNPGISRESAPEIVENPPPMSTSSTDMLLPAKTAPLEDASAEAQSTSKSGTRLPAVARALESGRLEEAQSLLTQADHQRIETRLLRARLLLRQGQAVQALREIESARTDAPGEARIFGVASELYSAMGKPEEADRELRLGLALDPSCAAIERARGVYLLQLPGAAQAASIHLKRALELEPDLAFAARPLAAAYRLTGSAFLRDQNPLEAVRAARAGLDLYPDDFDLRRLHADALLAVGSLRHAAEIFEELFAEGHSVEEDLSLASWRAGMGELVIGKKESAIDYFVRARELGMSDEGLASALPLLNQAAMTRVGRGIKAYNEGSLDDARDLFAEAAHFDPNNLAAANHLAVTHARLGMTDLAIEGWTRVLSAFDEAGGVPPEPVHLNLVRVLVETGSLKRASLVLDRYEPDALEGLSEPATAEELTACVEHLESAYRSASLKRAE